MPSSPSTARRIGSSASSPSTGCTTSRCIAWLSEIERERWNFGLSEDHATLHVRRKGETGRQSRQVPSIRLDEWVGDRTYALGKIDIEGAEPLAFRGAESMLAATNPPVWVMEAAGYSKLYGVSTAELLGFLEVRGFQSMTYDPRGRRLEQAPRPWERGLQNVLMVSRRRAAEVAERLQSQHDQ